MPELNLNTRAETVKEEWRPVVRAEKWYEVSNLGRVRRVAPGPGTYPGKVLKPGTTRRGYQYVRLWTGKKDRRASVHRLVTEAFIGPCPDGLEVNHIDGVKHNNALSNLEYVTKSENVRHCERLGLRQPARGLRNGAHTMPHRRPTGDRSGSRLHPERLTRGEKHHSARLLPADVAKIRVDLGNGVTKAELGRRYGISRTAVYHIEQGRNWKHL